MVAPNITMSWRRGCTLHYYNSGCCYHWRSSTSAHTLTWAFKNLQGLHHWPFIHRLLQSVQWTDLVFDQYLGNSLKSEAPQSYGSGQRINVAMNTANTRETQQVSHCGLQQTAVSCSTIYKLHEPCTINWSQSLSYEFQQTSKWAMCRKQHGECSISWWQHPWNSSLTGAAKERKLTSVGWTWKTLYSVRSLSSFFVVTVCFHIPFQQ